MPGRLLLSHLCRLSFSLLRRPRHALSRWPAEVLGLLILDEPVRRHGQAQDAQQNVELEADSQEGAEPKGGDEAQGFSEAVAGEGGFLVLLKQDAVQSWRGDSTRG